MEQGIRLIRLTSTESTNQYASNLIAREEAVHGMVITAREQTRGKGQEGNLWESKAGENLTISIVIQPKGLDAVKQFMLNKIASLAIKDFVRTQVRNHQVKIKWPNDVYIDNKKVAGVLINNTILGSQITWSVVGIGININQTVFESDAPNPVSLKNITGSSFNLDDCLTLLFEAFESRLRQLQEKNYSLIDSDYLAAMYRLGVFADYNYMGRNVNAKITGIGEFGHLQLVTKQGESLLCDLKEIKFLI